MKAVVLNQHGTLDQLQLVKDFPDPVVCEGHVVIRVRATSFNYHDVFTVRGMPGITIVDPCDALDIEQCQKRSSSYNVGLGNKFFR